MQFPAAAVVAKPTERPEQDEGQDDVEEREQAGPERSGRVEKIFGTADQVPAEDQPGCRVEGPDDVDEDRGDGLAGNQECVVGPEADAGKDYSDVAEVEEIRGAPGVPVGCEPEDETDEGEPTEPVWDFLAWRWRGGGHFVAAEGGIVAKGLGNPNELWR